jgi:hypothetical protein
VASIEATGTEQVVLSTDFGQVSSAPFPECTLRFAEAIEALWPARWCEERLITLFTDNPRRALGLSAPPR